MKSQRWRTLRRMGMKQEIDACSGILMSRSLTRVAALASSLALLTAGLRAQNPVPDTLRSQTVVTVRGLLKVTGKAANVWTLTLDDSIKVRDGCAADPEKLTSVYSVTFIGGKDGPQVPTLDGKRVEVTGMLKWPPCGVHSDGIVVKTIRELTTRSH